MTSFILSHSMNRNPVNGRFGPFGGRYVPETLMETLIRLETEFSTLWRSRSFRKEFYESLKTFAGRPTPLYRANRLEHEYNSVSSKKRLTKIYLKREDLCHTGAHKINNCVGQALLAIRMGKRRIVAETGAGQHGVATAAVCAHFGLECSVYMGSVDMERQEQNVYRMKLLGADVIRVDSGSKTLKDAINEAIRDWVTNVDSTHYLLGSTVGPHPYPWMVREFQSVIGYETKEQILQMEDRLPDAVVACVGGGSNALGIFIPFIEQRKINLYGVEAGGKGRKSGEHAATLSRGTCGVLHGSYTYILQDSDGQILPTHSISAGLDYPGVGPEHAWLKFTKRVNYTSVRDEQAVQAFHDLSRFEGIVPALESAHALAFVRNLVRSKHDFRIVVVNLSGRGDKDLEIILRRSV